ncbi:MAG: hypothetical protein JXB39_00210 [Deltaproteobacteria bacterium]|nr:hypothetical protein [Deltaproteobacteria bacterium]
MAPIPRWMLRLTLVAVVGIALLQAAGAFRTADRRALDLGLALRPLPSREAAPLLLEVDAAALARYGPLPWSPGRWAEIGDLLVKAGILEVYVLDPWTRLVASGDPPAPSRAVLFVPRLLRPGPGGALQVLDPPDDRAPFVAWDHQLHLPEGPDGVVRELAPARAGGVYGPSAFCAWARCPPGEGAVLPMHPLGPAGALPALSIADLAEGVRPAPSGRTVLLGITDPFFADSVHVGADALRMPWPEAVGQAAACARSEPAMPVPGSLGQAAITVLCGLAALLFVHFSRKPRTAWLPAAFPVLVAATGLGAAAAGWLVPPVVGSVLSAASPPLIAALASRRVAIGFLERVSLLLLQDGVRYAWRDTSVTSVRALTEKLGALTRNHTSTSRMALVRRVPGTSRLAWEGGYGIPPEALRADRLHLGSSPFCEALDRPGGASADPLLVDGLKGRVVPIRQDRWLAAFWVPIWDAGEEGTEPEVLARLARWMGLHLALEDAPRPSGLKDLLPDRLDVETDRVQRLFAAASEERRRQIQMLHALDLPLLTADLAGTILFANRAMQARLLQADLAGQPTLRGVLFRLMGSHGFEAAMRGLFAGGEPLAFPWTSSDDRAWRVTVEPVLEAGASGGEILGYEMHLQDETHLVQLREIRSSLVHFTRAHVRNALQVVIGYTGLLHRGDPSSENREMLDAVLSHAREVEEAVDALGRLGRSEDLDEPLELDLVRLVQEVVREADPAALARRLTLGVELPAIAMPVLAAPVRTRDAVASLVREACASAAPGSTVSIRIAEREDRSEVWIAWPGAGLDPAVRAHIHGEWHASLGALPRELHAFARAKVVLADLSLSGAPGRGVEVTFTLPRAQPGPAT